MADQNDWGFPSEAADWVTKPFARFLKIEAAAGGLLLVAVLLALVLANSPWRETFHSLVATMDQRRSDDPLFLCVVA